MVCKQTYVTWGHAQIFYIFFVKAPTLWKRITVQKSYHDITTILRAFFRIKHDIYSDGIEYGKLIQLLLFSEKGKTFIFSQKI